MHPIPSPSQPCAWQMHPTFLHTSQGLLGSLLLETAVLHQRMQSLPSLGMFRCALAAAAHIHDSEICPIWLHSVSAPLADLFARTAQSHRQSTSRRPLEHSQCTTEGHWLPHAWQSPPDTLCRPAEPARALSTRTTIVHSRSAVWPVQEHP